MKVDIKKLEPVVTHRISIDLDKTELTTFSKLLIASSARAYEYRDAGDPAGQQIIDMIEEIRKQTDYKL
jgi:hypothetical protein